ncbi:MAG: UDP-N-acetylmuramate dehydrogenase [Bacteroidales bacterium]|nr:UDP-N-acetylmuramate dehydrogenase [Bacteroidales bacterium]
MAEIIRNHSLKDYNTFGIDVKAKYFIELKNTDEVKNFHITNNKYKKIQKLIIGKGSNILFTEDFNGMVIHPNLKGVKRIGEDENHVLFKAFAGEIWENFVRYSVNNNYGGIENLSLIPGSVGASPIQNIGAYGVEVKDLIHCVETIDIETGELKIFSNSECHFGYRDSIFKSKYKNKYIINSVTYKLNKIHNYNIHYGNIENELKNFNEISISTIRQAVINIRKRKLPDPEIIGNAGSFFKNPIVDNSKIEELISKYPDIPIYFKLDNKNKIAAGWLIEQTGWKGEKIGDAGVHDKQALILINHGNATGKNILELANKIIKSVAEKFGVELEMEINLF